MAVSDRWQAVAGGVLALLFVAVLLVPSPRDPADRISWPTTADRGAEGLKGLQAWLERAGVNTYSLRRRYDTLAADARLAPTGNLLVMALPPRTPPLHEELQALHHWLERGNAVLLLMARGDLPAWSMRADRGPDVKVLAALGYRLAFDAAGDASDTPEAPQQKHSLSELLTSLERVDRRLYPVLPHHPVTAGVDAVQALAYPALQQRLRLEGRDGPRGVVPLLCDAAHRAPALWEVRVGRGRALVSRYAGLFGNAMLGRSDNARLAANIVTTMLGSAGTVVFDDMHMGLSDLYDANAFFSDSRLHVTLWFILGFWLLYLVGRSRRLGLPQRRLERYRPAEMVDALAGLFARRLDEATTARRLFRHFFDDVRARYGLPTTGEPTWELLARRAPLPAPLLRSLRARHARALAARGSDLAVLFNLLQRARREIHEEHGRHGLPSTQA
jgi:hypothetical protein